MTAHPQPLTPDEFIVWEHAQEAKHEFVAGMVVAFAGGTIEHATIAANLTFAVVGRLRGQYSCRTYGPDMLVATQTSIRYADLIVTCDERDRVARSTRVAFPKLIVEILSVSTASVDRGEKLDEYQTIESLEEYVLIDSRKRWVAIMRRSGETWMQSLPISTGTMHLASIDLDVALDELYVNSGVV